MFYSNFTTFLYVSPKKAIKITELCVLFKLHNFPLCIPQKSQSDKNITKSRQFTQLTMPFTNESKVMSFWGNPSSPQLFEVCTSPKLILGKKNSDMKVTMWASSKNTGSHWMICNACITLCKLHPC